MSRDVAESRFPRGNDNRSLRIGQQRRTHRADERCPIPWLGNLIQAIHEENDTPFREGDVDLGPESFFPRTQWLAFRQNANQIMEGAAGVLPQFAAAEE